MLMKSLFALLIGSCIVWSAAVAAATPAGEKNSAGSKTEGAKAADPGKPLKFTAHGAPYFVKNTFEPNAPQSFAVLKSLAEFENVFGVGMVMGGKKPEIDAATFKSQIVLAVVKRGPMCHYQVKSVAANAGGIEVRYEAKTDPPGSATFAVPMIVAVPAGKYSAVKFIENGKEVQVLK
jgi:hypothetical protein